jgi:hypothetical protein
VPCPVGQSAHGKAESAQAGKNRPSIPYEIWAQLGLNQRHQKIQGVPVEDNAKFKLGSQRQTPDSGENRWPVLDALPTTCIPPSAFLPFE